LEIEGGGYLKKEKFFRLLFLSFFGIILVYTSVVTAVYFYKNNQLVKFERSTNHQMLIKQAQKSMDQRIQVALSVIMQLQSSKTFKNYSSSSHNDNMRNYYNVQLFNELQRNMRGFESYKYNIGVMKEKDTTIITPQRTVQKDSFYKEIGINKKSTRELQRFITDNSWSSFFKIYPVKNSNNDLTVVKKARVDNGEAVLFFLTFPSKNLLLNSSPSIKSGFSIASKDEIILLDSAITAKKTDEIVTEKSLASINKKNEIVPVYTSEIHSNYKVHSIGSEILKNWSYVYITPANISHAIGWAELMKVFTPLVGLLIFGALLTMFIANYTYRPVRKVVSALKEGGELDTQDEFQFIHKKALEMKRLNQHLQLTIEQNQLPLKVKFLRDLLFGLESKEKIDIQLKQMHLDSFSSDFTLVIFSYGSNRELSEHLSPVGIHKVKSQLVSFLEETFKNQTTCEIIELESEKLVILLKETDIAVIKTMIIQFYQQLPENILKNIVASIAEPAHSIYDIEQVFKQASNLLEYRILVEKKKILTIEDIAHLENGSYYYPIEAEKDLIHFIVSGKKLKAFLMLDHIVKENLYEKKLNKQALSQFVFAIVSTVNRILQNVNKPVHEIFNTKDALYFELSTIEDKSTLEEKITSIFEAVFQEIDTNKEDENSIADQLVSYIHENYQNDISLSDLSEHFHLSSSYISTIFKSETGENFKEFLNRYRIQKAKEILSSQNIKVNSVAEMVGYNNVNTFIRLFKKYVGLSPGQYEKSI
jgi:two-component system, response regulator YesN